MGCFNYVHVDCPPCGETVEFQSKSGSCEMNTYHISNLPANDIDGILGDMEECPHCGFIVQIEHADDVPRMDFSYLVR